MRLPVGLAFIPPRVVSGGMKSVRKGLRSGEIEKDTYERLHCNRCEKALKSKNEPEEIGTVRVCPECGREWKELK